MNIHLEQLVYGSLPTWGRGYDVVGRSAGCSASIQSEVVAICRKYGQPPSGEPGRQSLFAIRLKTGHWAIVGVFPLGHDDQGRPGALLFHALIVTHRNYLRAGGDPFRLAPALRCDWQPCSHVETMDFAVPDPKQIDSEDLVTTFPSSREIIARLSSVRPGKARKVACVSDKPIDGMVQSIWPHLPRRVRRRAWVATWAYSASISFDLVGMPRPVGQSLDASYQIFPTTNAENPSTREARSHRPSCRPIAGGKLFFGGVASATLAGIVGFMIIRSAQIHPSPTNPSRSDDPRSTRDRSGWVDESAFDLERVDRDLRLFADRFDAFDLGPIVDRTSVLLKIDEKLHYAGPLLSEVEVQSLSARASADQEPEFGRVLEWHRKILGVRQDGAGLPVGFSGAPPATQLGLLARSFRLAQGSRADEVVALLSEKLSRSWAVRPSHLAGRFPALADYAKYLGRLPRSDDPAR